MGRRVATVPGFGYSAALAHRHEVWTDRLMASFITNPKAIQPGTSMPETGLWVSQAEDVVAFLKTTRGPSRISPASLH
jgi:cytochrome c